jgi:hypothetical protein
LQCLSRVTHHILATVGWLRPHILHPPLKDLLEDVGPCCCQNGARVQHLLICPLGLLQQSTLAVLEISQTQNLKSRHVPLLSASVIFLKNNRLASIGHFVLRPSQDSLVTVMQARALAHGNPISCMDPRILAKQAAILRESCGALPQAYGPLTTIIFRTTAFQKGCPVMEATTAFETSSSFFSLWKTRSWPCRKGSLDL